MSVSVEYVDSTSVEYVDSTSVEYVDSTSVEYVDSRGLLQMWHSIWHSRSRYTVSYIGTINLT